MLLFLKVRNETLASDLPLSGSVTGPLRALEPKWIRIWASARPLRELVKAPLSRSGAGGRGWGGVNDMPGGTFGAER